MIFQTRSDGSTSVPTPAESVSLSLARSIRRENGDISRRFPDPFPVLPSLPPSGAYCLSRLDTSFRIRFFLQSLAISTRNLSPPDTQTEESNGGGGGIETREEGEIGGEKEGYRSYIVMSLLQSPTCDNVGDFENATGLG